LELNSNIFITLGDEGISIFNDSEIAVYHTPEQAIRAFMTLVDYSKNLELLFSAPTLRPFNFTFKLASRSPAESEMIRSIIRFFKQGMSPIRSQSNLFLKAPHTFQIQYLHRNEEHKFLNKFKECALQSFNVN